MSFFNLINFLEYKKDICKLEILYFLLSTSFLIPHNPFWPSILLVYLGLPPVSPVLPLHVLRAWILSPVIPEDKKAMICAPIKTTPFIWSFLAGKYFFHKQIVLANPRTYFT